MGEEKVSYTLYLVLLQGEKGDLGPRGPRGIVGDKGLQGVSGPPGDEGPTGDTVGQCNCVEAELAGVGSGTPTFSRVYRNECCANRQPPVTLCSYAVGLVLQ